MIDAGVAALVTLGKAFWCFIQPLGLGFGYDLASMLGIARSTALGQNMLNNDILGDRTNLI